MPEKNLHKNPTNKEGKPCWQAPELLDLTMSSTAGNKDAIANNEGRAGYQNKLEVSPS